MFVAIILVMWSFLCDIYLTDFWSNPFEFSSSKTVLKNGPQKQVALGGHWLAEQLS